MPVPPPAFEVRCPQCGWRQLFQPRSDALAASSLPPQCCPRCQHPELQLRPAAGGVWAKLRRWLG